MQMKTKLNIYSDTYVESSLGSQYRVFSTKIANALVAHRKTYKKLPQGLMIQQAEKLPSKNVQSVNTLKDMLDTYGNMGIAQIKGTLAILEHAKKREITISWRKATPRRDCPLRGE
jgi:hypothetical protein